MNVDRTLTQGQKEQTKRQTGRNDGETERQTDRAADREADIQTKRQTGKQKDTHRDRWVAAAAGAGATEAGGMGDFKGATQRQSQRKRQRC